LEQESESPLSQAVTERLFFEEVQVGQVWISKPRLVCAEDVRQFAILTGDQDPLHTDPAYAAETPYGQLIAHGLLGMSLLAGLSSECPPMRNFALSEVRDWQFRRPIFLGDSVNAEVEITSMRPRGRRCGEIAWNRRLRNQIGEIVQSGTFVTLVACRAPNQRARPIPPKSELSPISVHSISEELA
jgi:acyl dehydratase